jgi:hypothetical protein
VSRDQKMTSAFRGIRDQVEMNTQKWFSIFVAIHLFVWTLMPSLIRGNLPFDTTEGIAWGNVWALGYEKHPFLAPWLTAGATDVFHAVGWPQYLLSQVAVIICFWAMWRLARFWMPAVHAFASILLLEGIYYYTVASTQFNPNVLMLPLWALSALSFYKAYVEDNELQWFLTGLFVGLAMLSKYESLLLLLAMFIFSLSSKQARSVYLKPGPYIAAAVCFVIFLPNLLWLIHHHFLPLQYTQSRLDTAHYSGAKAALNHLVHPVYFIFEQCGALLPMLIMFSPLFFAKKIKSDVGAFNRQFLWIVGVGPFLLALMYSALTGAWLHSLWAFPFFSFAGIILMVWVKPSLTKQSLKPFFLTMIILACLVLILRASFLFWQPYFSKHGTAALFPGKRLADRVTSIWQNRFDKPLAYVAGKHSYVTNIAAYSKDKPVAYFNWDKTASPWLNEDALRQKGAMFVWAEDGNAQTSVIPADVAKRFPCAKPIAPLILNHLTKAHMKAYAFGLAVLPPKAQCQTKAMDGIH